MPKPNPDALWPDLVVSAFAQREAGAYEHLDHGNPARALEALTGRPATRTSLTFGGDVEALWRTIQAGRGAGRAMVLSARERSMVDEVSAGGIYAVLDAYAKAGVKMVKLYNPTPAADVAAESMVLELPVAQVLGAFETLDVAGG